MLNAVGAWSPEKPQYPDPSIQQAKDRRLVDKMDSVTKCVFGALALGAVGDTLGFGSGHDPKPGVIHIWELYGNSTYIKDVIGSKFQGSYRNIHFRVGGQQVWVVSDDSILHMMQAQTIAALHEPTPEEVVSEIAVAHVKTLREQVDWQCNARCFGRSTQNTYRLIQKDPTHWNHYISYNPQATGCGGSMRGMVFGLIYPGETNRVKLISTALNAGFLTNPSLVGALGIVSTAALAAFSLEDLSVSKWMSELFKVFEGTRRYLLELKANGVGHPQKYQELIEGCLDQKEWDSILGNWNEYYARIMDSIEQIPAKGRFPATSEERDAFHIAIEERANGRKSNPQRLTIGDRGETSVMLAFHGLLLGVRRLLDFFPVTSDAVEASNPGHLRELFQQLSKGQQEQVVDEIVNFTVLHGGDNDSTGGIALSLFGSIFGVDGVADHHVFETEVMSEIMQVVSKLGKLAKNALSRNPSI